LVAFCLDQQFPWTIFDRTHGVRGISYQIHNDLLNLNPITPDRQQFLGKIGLNYDPVALELAHRQRDHLSGYVIQIDRFERSALLTEERPQSCDHFRSTIAVANCPSRGFPCSFQIRRIGMQHPKARFGAGDDTRQRLINFMAIDAATCPIFTKLRSAEPDCIISRIVSARARLSSWKMTAGDTAATPLRG
jgi:hypothetical protein